MNRGNLQIAKEYDKGVRTSILTREYILNALKLYRYNENVPISRIVNKAVENFLIEQDYLDSEGNITRKKIVH